MKGAQYQHISIPGMKNSTPQTLRYQLIGSVDGYREKVYGADDPDIVVSPSEFEGIHKIWDLRYTYRVLWKEYHDLIFPTNVGQKLLINLTDSYDMVFSTVPAPSLCRFQNVPGEIAVNREHEFKYKSVWIDQCWYGPLRSESDLWDKADNLVICNGLPVKADDALFRTGWYRTSHIYGNLNTEWAELPEVESHLNRVPNQISSVRKPISNDCNCWPDIIRAGRYGAWRKGILTHHVFQEAMAILA